MKLTKNFKLEENFYINEFLSDADTVKTTEEQISNITKLAEHMQEFRDMIKREFRITSGVRSLRYNTAIGGSRVSYHLVGKACDFEMVTRTNNTVVEDYGDWTIETLLPVFEKCGFKNVGFYRHNGKFQWIHADIGIPWNAIDNWRSYSSNMSYQIVEV